MSDTSKSVRTRFAPSPTGYVHIGSLRTALFSFLFARHSGGTHVLRIEDTDQNRLVEGAVANLLSVMARLGVEFDEGAYVSPDGKVVERGGLGPYLQSERLSIYKKHVEELVASGKAYYCFCTQERLDDLRKEQTALKKPPMYDRLCKGLSDEDVRVKLDEAKTTGKYPVVRFAIPDAGQTTVHDLVFGDITYENKLLDDQVILKSDGFPTYHLAVVVDDHYMQITHVIRGEEWIPSTPKHLLLYQAFGWQPTEFAHLPLILNPDKSKLSKRQGDVSVEDFLDKGYLPEALLNFVAFLGWNPKTEQEIFPLEGLVRQFDLSKVNKSGAVLDVNKLDWLNGQYIKQKSNVELVKLLVPYWLKDELLEVQADRLTIKHLNSVVAKPEYLEAIASLERERLKKISEIVERTCYFFSEPDYNPKLLAWKKSTLADAKQKLTLVKEFLGTLPDDVFANAETLQDALMGYILEHGLDVGAVLWPLRVALTGQQFSPGPTEVASTLFIGLGREAIISRIDKATK